MKKVTEDELFNARHLLQEVYACSGEDDNFRVTVLGCGQDVVTYRTGGDVLTHVSTGQIVTIWRRAQEKGGRK